MLKAILKRVDDKNPPTENGLTPLHLGALKGHLRIVKELIKFVDGDQNPPALKLNDWTPLHMAAFSGHLDVVKYIVGLPDVDVNQLDSFGASALDYAAEQGHQDVVVFLTKLQ